ncbi:hypothetical protein [Vibrio harveyi]|uniref:hypothetical protein n=1 Tax=Vibrio harveyi TaxID=669 RepID=UPI003CF5E4E2
MSNKKQNGLSIAEQEVDAASVFANAQRQGYSNSLLSYTLPFFPADRDKSSKIDDKRDDEGKLIKKASYIHTLSHRNIIVKYHAVAIQSGDGEDFYFPSKNEELIFKSILEMVGAGLAQMRMESTNNFIVTFRIQDLREYLKDIGRSRSGKQINTSLQILERSTVEVEYRGSMNNGRDKATMSGTYLQSATRIESDDPRKDGLYQARLHPNFARDIMKGDYRFIENKFLTVKGKSFALFESILHELRHKFTQASAKPSVRIHYEFNLSDIFFVTGYTPSFKEPTGRRNIAEIEKLLLESGVINEKKDFKRKSFFDDERETVDFHCTIVTSVEWGESQRRDNAVNKQNKTALEFFQNVQGLEHNMD